MGKQRTKVLRKKANILLERFPDLFVDNFEDNKKAIDSLGVFNYSKTDRNIVAGIITKMVEMQKKTAGNV